MLINGNLGDALTLGLVYTDMHCWIFYSMNHWSTSCIRTKWYGLTSLDPDYHTCWVWVCSIEHDLLFFIDLHFRLDRSLSVVPGLVVYGWSLVFCLYLSSSRLGLFFYKYTSSYRDHRCSLWSLPRTDHVVVWRWFTVRRCLCDVN